MEKLLPDVIRIKGARQHNLKSISVDIPLNRLVAITGPSGSGKSTLTYHILYTEGQRRYVETFSPYSRQFLERLDKPAADKIEGIPPALAIEAGTVIKSSRSTVGTLTELTSYFKLLFSRAAIPHCPKCNISIVPKEPHKIIDTLQQIPGDHYLIAFPWHRAPICAEDHEKLRDALVTAGFSKFWDQGKIQRIESSKLPSKDPVWIILDRLDKRSTQASRLIDSLTQAYKYGNGRLAIIDENSAFHFFTSRRECPVCGFTPPAQNMNLFSFNNPVGACPECRGFGKIIDIDIDLIIPDPGLSIEDGAVKPYRTRRRQFRRLINFCLKEGIPIDRPFGMLTPEQKKAVIEGKGRYRGIRGFFQKLSRKSYKLPVRVFLSRYRTYLPCPACRGTRFQPQSLFFKVHGKTIADYYRIPISELYSEFGDAWEEEKTNSALRTIVAQIRQRLDFLVKIGLGYLTLERQSRSLSGGEVQRLHLTRVLGSELVNLLYILDEPTIGLHPRDYSRLYLLLRTFVNRGNTVVVVDHEPEIVKRCDLVLDLGPAGGERGGKIMFFGTPSEIINTGKSITAKYLAPEVPEPLPGSSGSKESLDRYIEIVGASENNLKNIDVKIPLGLFVCVTGVSGSGKSTLVEEVIYKGISREKGLSSERPGKYVKISGLSQIDSVVFIDQHPIGKTPRSNLLTYINIFSAIRNLFSRTEQARKMGLKPGDFSFNTPGGRCSVCKGSGFKRIEMQFMADVLETCPACKGTRYLGRVLVPRYKGYNIAQIQEITVEEALKVFHDTRAISNPLNLVADLGLNYIKLGQPLDTLSGGESQRLKLVRYLTKNYGKTLFIMDEPTTGLHPSEIERLYDILVKLIENGNTVLVVEHNLQIIRKADWIIDLGPEGGDDGGHVVASGPPWHIAEVPESHTGRFLRYDTQKIASNTGTGRIQHKKVQHEGLANKIVIEGARLHNLDIERLEIPRDRLVVITGISGSGKSTLAFDLLFAEGQRRYLECLSAYVRQYFKIMEKGEVDEIYGLPPTVAIEQRMGRLDRRSTVGTVSEIYHFLRLLFSKIGKQHCPHCGRLISPLETDQILDEIKKLNEEEITILAPVVVARKGVYRNLLEGYRKKGYSLARIDGEIINLAAPPELNRYVEHTIEIVIASIRPGTEHRLLEQKLSEALSLGNNTLVVITPAREVFFSPELYCHYCCSGYLPLDPRLFSFNSEYGACPYCEGRGIRRQKLLRHKLAKHEPCPLCNGKRLNPQALNVKIDGISIDKLVDMTVSELKRFLPGWLTNISKHEIAQPLIEEILQRLQFLEKVGLGYLQLNRAGDTLSGGETQRLRLAAQLGTNLKGVCYIVDEPTIGLHPYDHRKLLSSLKYLRDRGNTVIVVEHDIETMKAADFIVDLGPGAGTEGGKVIFAGTVAGIEKVSGSYTARFLTETRSMIPDSPRRKLAPLGWLKIKNATIHNLKNISVSIPLGNLVCVTGVSGSGKSSLVTDTLFEGLTAKGSFPYASFEGHNNIRAVRKVDHNPIGRTPRSIPATYVGFFDHVRKLFASTREARTRGFTPSSFSFNVRGGRCETCEGQGEIKVSMNFLPDVYYQCEECEGRRFKPEILEVKYKGKNISEVLQMTVEEAVEFFSAVKKIGRPLQLLNDLGLGYLTLGQPSPSLSGGECQRIKLIAELAKNSVGNALYILDEPTTGLHPYDIKFLLKLLHNLTDGNNTVVVIEHNPDIIANADYIIDLGPGGGPEGGRVIATGTVSDIISHDKSKTGSVLKEYFNTR